MGRRRTTHIPRCPLCGAKMEEVQLRWENVRLVQGQLIPAGWEEVWGCSECHTNHVFPARLEILEKARNSLLLEKSHKILHLPK